MALLSNKMQTCCHEQTDQEGKELKIKLFAVSVARAFWLSTQGYWKIDSDVLIIDNNIIIRLLTQPKLWLFCLEPHVEGVLCRCLCLKFMSPALFRIKPLQLLNC